LVEHIASYATTSSLKTADGKSLTKEECDDLVTNPDLVLCFASPSAVRGFIDGLKAGSSRDEKSWVLKEKAQVVVIGPTTEDAARAHFNHITVSPWHEITALIQSVLAVRIS
jgi:uroporphyrinogen-III synthase